MKRLSFILCTVLFMAFIALPGCKDNTKGDKPSETPTKEPSKQAKKEPYKIGALFAVSGPASSLGLPEKQTVEMLVEEINAEGGINGHPIEVVFYDTQGAEDKAVTYAKRLIIKDKVSAIIGPTRSGPSLAILDTINAAKIPLVSCAASYKIVADEEGNARKWIFKTPQSDSMAVKSIFEYFNKKGIEKVAIMNVSNGYGESGRAELKRLAPNYNIEIVADDRFGQDDTDMTPQLTKVKGTDAQALVVWAVQKAPAIVAKNFKTLGMDKNMLLVQSHGVASKKFIGLCGDAADGQILPAGRLLVVEQLPESDPQKDLLAEYKKNFEDRYGPVSTFGGHAYDALMLLKKAMEKAGTDDPAKVRDALEGIDRFVGTGGVFKMSAADHNGLSKDAFVMVKIENKDWKLIAH